MIYTIPKMESVFPSYSQFPFHRRDTQRAIRQLERRSHASLHRPSIPATAGVDSVRNGRIRRIPCRRVLVFQGIAYFKHRLPHIVQAARKTRFMVQRMESRCRHRHPRGPLCRIQNKQQAVGSQRSARRHKGNMGHLVLRLRSDIQAF